MIDVDAVNALLGVILKRSVTVRKPSPTIIEIATTAIKCLVDFFMMFSLVVLTLYTYYT